MDLKDYGRMVERLGQRRFELTEKRWELETQLKEINVELKEIEGTLSHLLPLAGETVERDSIAGLGLTNAMRKIIKCSESPLSATEIRVELEKKGFNFSDYEMPGASIFTILYRLKKKGEITTAGMGRPLKWKSKQK